MRSLILSGLILLTVGCQSLSPSVYRLDRAKTTVVIADPSSVQSSWRELGGQYNDGGEFIDNKRLEGIVGYAKVLVDGWCEVWVSWNATIWTLVHELTHCEQKEMPDELK